MRHRSVRAHAVASSLAALLMLTLAIPTAMAHGGRYRDPNRIAPPTPTDLEPGGRVGTSGRIPPTDPPAGSDNVGGTTSGGGESSGENTPPPSAGVGGGGPAVGPRTPPGAAGGPGRAGSRIGATTPGRGRKAASTPGGDSWEVWWEYNRAPLLNLRERLEANVGISGSADWLLGNRSKSAAYDSERPGARRVREQVLPILLRTLGDGFFDVRAAAALALGKTCDAAAFDPIVGALADEHPTVAESAALALGILGDTRAVPLLLALSLDEAAGRGLVERPAGVPFRTRSFATIALGLIGDASATDALIRVAGSQAGSVHRDIPVAAVTALGLMDPAQDETVRFLEGMLRERRNDAVLRSTAAVALGRLGRAESAAPLRRALRDGDLAVRRSAVLALGQVGKAEDRQTVTMLGHTVRKANDPLSRNWACIALGRIGSPESERILKETVSNATGAMQSFATIGLALWGKTTGNRPATGAFLRASMRRTRVDSNLGAHAIALGILGHRAAETDLQRLLGRKNPALRGQAAMALGMMQAKSSVPLIRALIDEGSRIPSLQKDAAIALGLIGDRDAVGILSRVLTEARTEYVQSSASLALGFIGDRSAIAILEEVINRDGVADVARAQAVVALGVVAERRALPALHVIAVDTNYRALVEALEELLTIT